MEAMMKNMYKLGFFLFGLAATMMFLVQPAQAILVSAIEPVVDIGPDGSRAVKIEAFKETSYMWLPFADPIDTSIHSEVTVAFDLYRTVSPGHDLYWMWTDADDSSFYEWSEPLWGAQWDIDQRTYPYGWFNEGGTGGTTVSAGTVYGAYTHVSLTLDFEDSLASASYYGSDMEPVAINGIYDLLYGFDITLLGLDDYDSSDIVWIDNFIVTGSKIYDSQGFENFDLGALHGQDGWVTHDEAGVVPEPSTILLVGSGLLGIVGFYRRRRR